MLCKRNGTASFACFAQILAAELMSQAFVSTPKQRTEESELCHTPNPLSCGSALRSFVCRIRVKLIPNQGKGHPSLYINEVLRRHGLKKVLVTNWITCLIQSCVKLSKCCVYAGILDFTSNKHLIRNWNRSFPNARNESSELNSTCLI